MVAKMDQIKLYPNTKQPMVPGDVIYSSKGWSTFLVGHVGIVGTDLRVHHSHPRGGFSESLEVYLSRHRFGGTITIFRPKQGALSAANWAEKNIGLVNRYMFDPQLNNIGFNYCSKFIWQAFWFSENRDITTRKLTNNKKRWVYPFNIKTSWNMELIAQIKL